MTSVDDNHVTLDVTGMTCAACAGRVEKVLRRIDGVRDAVVSLPLERADVTLASSSDVSGLVTAIEAAGYHAFPRGGSTQERSQRRAAKAVAAASDRQRTMLLAAFAALLALPFMVDMGRMLAGAEDHLLPPAVQAWLASLAQFVCGWRFYRGALASLRSGFANMDVLVAVGTSAAYGLSMFNLMTDRIHHGGGLYFEAGVTVLALLLLGKVLEGQAKSGASAALAALTSGMPSMALKIVGGLEAEVPAADVVPGDLVVVRPGAVVPADGRIIEGEASFDEALITGESMPVRRISGEQVISGSIASGGRVLIEVTATGDDTRLARIGRLIEDAEIARSPTQQLADRISAVFVPAVMAIAVISGLGWLAAGAGVERALLIAVSVLVVACPCALGLATPIALVAGANAAARAGLIVTDHAALEAAGRVTRVAFDKTGTLTEGRPRVSGIATDMSPDNVLALAAALASRSDHPLDRAIVGAASDEGVAVPKVDDFSATAGKGLQASFEGRLLRLGNADYVRAGGVTEQTLRTLGEREALRTAGSITYLAEGGSLLAIIGFADAPRPEARAAIDALQQDGVAVTVLSGDRKEAVAAFAREVGLEDALGGLSPEQKIRAVNAMRAEGAVVALVGDGINDAPALRAADVGIAMGSGTDAAKAAAGVTLARPDARLVASFLAVGRATRATIWQNLTFAFVFNGFGIPLAVFGKLSPAVAGAAMAASSVSVVLNAWRLARRDFPVR